MSKLSRWEKIAARNRERGIGDIDKSEKAEIFDQLSGVTSVMDDEEKPEAIGDKSKPTPETAKAVEEDTNKEDKSEVGSRSINQEYKDGVEGKSIVKDDEPRVEREGIKKEESPIVGDGSANTRAVEIENKQTTNDQKEQAGLFSKRVSQGLETLIEGHKTKEDTHKKTSFLLRDDLRMMLENYDKALGGRIKGTFLNFLMEDFFNELMESDPKWRKVLNKKIPNFK